MKKLLLSVSLLVFTVIVFGQTSQDIKDFIIEKVDANDPIPSYDNAVFFQNILRHDVEKLAGKKLSDGEYQNIFIYGRDCYMDNNRNKWMFSVSQIIDLRGISKVSVTYNTGKQNFYAINVYKNPGYFATEYSNSTLNNPKWEGIDKMSILIGDNKEAAIQIKKAIISLCLNQGIVVKDGDLF